MNAGYGEMDSAGLPPLAPPGYVYGTVCRVNFWVKMTTALGITQIVIGASCMVFYTVAFFTDTSTEHIIRYLAMGIVTGIAITIAGILGMLCCKKKTKCTITSFLVTSVVAVIFALFPMVLGIVGATSSVLGEESLLMPICQLVFSTVEIVVATWSIGICCQAICCPNATFGHVSTRLPTGLGITQFISSGDGQHVVLFTSTPTSPGMYNSVQPPYYIQQGVQTMSVGGQPVPGMMCSVGQTNLTPPPSYYAVPQGGPLVSNPQPSHVDPKPTFILVPTGGCGDGDSQDLDKLLEPDHPTPDHAGPDRHGQDHLNQDRLAGDHGMPDRLDQNRLSQDHLSQDRLIQDRDEPLLVVDPGDGQYEVEDEETHLLC